MLATDARIALENAGYTCDIGRDYTTTKVNTRKMVLIVSRNGLRLHALPIVKDEVKAGDVETMVGFLTEHRSRLMCEKNMVCGTIVESVTYKGCGLSVRRDGRSSYSCTIQIGSGPTALTKSEGRFGIALSARVWGEEEIDWFLNSVARGDAA